MNAYRILLNQPVEEIQVTVPFGEYANPSFESQVETLAKARPGVPLMSVEAQIEELYGDSKDEDWKQEEVARLKAEQGIVECEEPAVRTFARGFSLNTKEGEMHEGKDNEPRVPNGAG